MRCLVWNLSSFLCFVLAASCVAFAVDPAAEKSWETFASQPQKVQILIGMPEQLKTLLDVDQLSAELAPQLTRQTGASWQSRIEFRTTASNRAVLSPNPLPYFFDPAAGKSEVGTPFDKTFVILLSGSGSGINYQVLEYDWFLESASDVVSGQSSLTTFLSSDLVHAIRDVHRPLMKIQGSDGRQFSSILKGGELTFSLDENQDDQQNQIYAPVRFHFDRKGNLIRREYIPWTYLKVEQRNRSLVEGEMISVYGNVLSGGRRRIETYAYRLRANFPTTELTINRRDESKSPLAGYLVKTTSLQPPSGAADSKELKILQQSFTTRDGSLALRTQADQPIVMVNVISGESILAKVPFLVGSAREVKLEVPNDLVRLSVEGDLQTLETELVDLVARRAVLMATVKKAGKEGDLKMLEQVERELRAFPDSQTLLQEITVVRVNSVKEALKQRNKAAAIKVEKLCSEATQLVEKHLDDQIVFEFLGEITELKKMIESST